MKPQANFVRASHFKRLKTITVLRLTEMGMEDGFLFPLSVEETDQGQEGGKHFNLLRRKSQGKS